jgi:surfeit locus 1 family protein
MLSRLRSAGLIVPTAMTIISLAILLGLGTWQMQRRAWKEGLIATLTARSKAPPVTLADALERARRGEDTEYLRVRVRGGWRHDAEVHLHAIERGVAGWHVITPLRSAPDGTIVFVNRGFVPNALKAQAARPASLVQGEAEFNGLVRSFPTGKGAFVPDNDRAQNQWYWLDTAGLRSAAGLGPSQPAAPFLIEMEAVTVPVPPAGGATRLALSNRHFEYALTWYGLALTLVGVFAAYALSRLKAEG